MRTWIRVVGLLSLAPIVGGPPCPADDEDRPAAGEVLPFPSTSLCKSIGPTMPESVHKWREAPSHLPEDASSMSSCSTTQSPGSPAPLAARPVRLPCLVSLTRPS